MKQGLQNESQARSFFPNTELTILSATLSIRGDQVAKIGKMLFSNFNQKTDEFYVYLDDIKNNVAEIARVSAELKEKLDKI